VKPSGDGGQKPIEPDAKPAPTPDHGFKSEAISKLRMEALKKVADDKLILDAHCHYFGYLQETEGIPALSRAMEKAGVGYAVLTGCPFKKTWVGISDDDPPPVHHLYDDGDLYAYSATDGNLYRHLDAHKKTDGLESIAKFTMLGCGMNLGDYSAGQEAKELLENYHAIAGFGELVLQSDDINNVTIKGGNWTHTTPAVKRIIAVAAAHDPPLPFVFYSDARSSTSKPYRAAFEYLDEIDMVCGVDPRVKCLWCCAGVFSRGMWSDYLQILKALVEKHSNLYISFTPALCAGKYGGITREMALELAEKLPGRIVLGTTVRGLFEKKPPEAFGEASYEEECKILKYFADQIHTRAGEGAAAWLRYRTACKIFNLPMPDDPSAETTKFDAIEKGKSIRGLLTKTQSVNTQNKESIAFLSSLAYGGGKTAVCPPSISGKKWDTIDCHLHLLDFLQKSSGTSAALKAMDECDCKKAVVFGMPCCKKWCFYRPEQPLYYQDDNGPCYVYAYADQMVADAWLALPDDQRARLAPCFAAFDPTDLAGISHIKRMYDKYPGMWRAIGEVMCRHDDLTTMLLGKEIPRVDHAGLDRIYEFAIKNNLPVLVHHNADRVGDNDGTWEYVSEVETVLKKYPTLRFTWVHAGVSRRCSEPNHHEMIDRMCSTFPNLKIDISWVVWEDVICDEKGVIKPGWVDCIQKHHTKFFIGSDNVAQYFPIKDTTINLLAGNITKYYQLFDKLDEEAGKNVAYNNAENDYFKDWNVPSGDEPGRYTRMPSYYPTECLDPTAGSFVYGKSDVDDDGMY